MSHNIELAQFDSARQVEYRKKFQMVKQSLLSIGFSMDDVQSIFTILSAILHIGDVSFIPHGSNDGVRVKNNGTIDKSLKRRRKKKHQKQIFSFSCRTSSIIND
jgi:myosin heavy subunit